MRPLSMLRLYRGRLALGFDGGQWRFASPVDGKALMVIASWGGGWDHVSVSRRARTPVWKEMCTVKQLFFEDEETVMQLHVPPADHINVHPHCLHLWRPQRTEIPRPPAEMVG